MLTSTPAIRADDYAVGTFDISNVATAPKAVAGQSTIGQRSSAAVISMVEMGGVWLNTTDQIDEIELLTTNGSATLAAGTYLMVFGSD